MRARSLVFCLSLLLFAGPAVAQEADVKPKVMILGSFHFAQPKQDLINVGAGDVLSEKRQQEIAEVVERLAAFAPTKIGVELTPEHQARFSEAYRAYRAGERLLMASEAEQIGMRLAARLGHDKVHAVDAGPHGMDFNAMFAAAEEHGQAKLLADLKEAFADVEVRLRKEQGPDRTIRQMLIFHNGPWPETVNAGYLQMAVIGSQDTPTGAREVGKWYQRNVNIYANIARLAEAPDERILVVFGSGHKDQLTDFFEENPDFELVSALDYLRD